MTLDRKGKKNATLRQRNRLERRRKVSGSTCNFTSFFLANPSQPTTVRPHEHTAATCNTKREVAEAELAVGQPSKDLERHRKFTLAVREAKQAWAWNGSIAAATLFGNGQGGGGIGTSGGGTKPISPPLPLPMAPIPPPVINGATTAMASSNPNSNDAWAKRTPLLPLRLLLLLQLTPQQLVVR